MERDRLTPRDHARVASFIHDSVGIQLPEQKRNLVESRLRKRQNALSIPSLGDYIDYALSTKEEHIHLIDNLTTNKTEFFREASHYPVLETHVTNWRRSQSEKQHFHIWSAGCSSGEEPYTLAMVLKPLLGQHFSITATDISLEMLEIASKGLYLRNQIQPIPEGVRKRFLLKHRDKTKPIIKISQDIRQHIRFGQFNLLNDNYAAMPKFNVIFCRNVMIYFSDDIRQRIIRQFLNKLTDDGLLFIGHSESIRGIEGIEQLVPTVYRKISS
ncbi:hypothetical protein OE749_17235 [Aestuariibacter sp. AA17]|uniref:Chemotaxis protein methyltransferase n=1 Tax=Fluctibacter corallii TaxID=2984329 RepID=A0ABT3ACZ2_9ALTE|nr:CheR family methyltransferase [Aestuariibacter sp. AA17]MCV2886442.1 hypothetical protein [Aestuariibacter sp. AA17]